MSTTFTSVARGIARSASVAQGTASVLCALVLLSVACGDSGGSGGSGEGGAGTGGKLDPGTLVDGCFDCADTEYCIILSLDAGDEHYCAPDDCELECQCLMDDSARRHSICPGSCQEDSGLVTCFE